MTIDYLTNKSPSHEMLVDLSRFLFCCGNRPHGFLSLLLKTQPILAHLKILLSSKSSFFSLTQILKNSGVKNPPKSQCPQKLFSWPPLVYNQHPLGVFNQKQRPPETHRQTRPLGLRNCTRYRGAPLRGARTYGAGRWRLLKKISALEGPRVPSWERIHIFWIY